MDDIATEREVLINNTHNERLDQEHRLYLDKIQPEVDEYQRKKSEIQLGNFPDLEKPKMIEVLGAEFYEKNGFHPENSEIVLGSVKKWLNKGPSNTSNN